MPDDILNELESISPELAKIPKENTFPVQDEYFTQLPEAIQQRIHNEQKPDNIVRGHIFGPVAYKWAAACVAILVLGSGYYYLAWNSFYDSNSVSTEAYVLENVDEEIISDYLTAIPVKANKNIETIDNSLENIDEELILDEL